MPDERLRIYWDANVFLSYINGTNQRMSVLDALLDDSVRPDGERRIHTSAISQLEVAFARHEQESKSLDSNVEQAIDELWQDRRAIEVVEFHPGLLYDGRALIRLAITNGWSLKALDAFHLATARWLQVGEFHTYDERLYKFSNHLGFPIIAPYHPQPRLIEG